ncbi:hypothetical protein CONCODRAFT_170906 [Conidiobolus coronatus NRRL 28638]|uniref:Alpha/beta hydrolase fold-3 domain-containing protein n=1 Tax=Conidiobolus coronatus (strain ATCC 28846 / CBS 209.66 / NRRL 28638) TaxID=796925 RepID=A0A137P5J1_CONC2|nr:hypothetical protein CONCODRAFT_170906 [Conidiobolus coronatus NRRL 28638]|eukprot:KXN70282.1 hypothetical protein CONCODRAFT_170906 [Conidiobolus coronatus NRRL 28638]
MTKDNIKQFRQQSVRDLQSLWNSKDHFSHQSPLATYDDTKKWGGILQRSSLRDKAESNIAKKPNLYKAPSESQLHHIDPLKFPWVRNKQSPIAMGSKLTYFDDRILTGELFRALPIFYLGPNNDSDFINDYFISPLKAPDHLLAQFPKTYFVCGDRDPLVDDTILMAAKIKKAKQKWSKSIHRIRNRKGNEIQVPTPFTNQVALDRNFDGLVIGNDRSSLPNSAYNSSDSESDDDYASASEGESALNRASTTVPKHKKTMYNRLITRVRSYVSILQQPPAIPKANSDHLSTAGKDDVHVKIINGVSHGFLNYADFLPEGKAAIRLNGNWLLDLLKEDEEEEEVNKAE